MKVTSFGAAGNVTGCAYYIESKHSNILIDFGIFQGDHSLEDTVREGKDIIEKAKVSQRVVRKDEIGFALSVDTPEKAVKTIPDEIRKKLSIKLK
jgi:hypothetical protein